MKIDFRASEAEVERQLLKIMPLGTPHSEVIRIMETELGLPAPYPIIMWRGDDSVFDGMSEPGHYRRRDGRVVRSYSTARMKVAEYKTKKFVPPPFLFIRVHVIVDFGFDQDDELIMIHVKPEADAP